MDRRWGKMQAGCLRSQEKDCGSAMGKGERWKVEGGRWKVKGER